MSVLSSDLPPLGAGPDPGSRQLVERLAALERASGSTGAREAAQILARELERRGARVRVEGERVHGTYWVPIGLSCALAAACAALRRRPAAAAGALCPVSRSC